MRDPSNTNRKFLPRTFLGRFQLACLSLIFLPFSAWFLYVVAFAPRPPGNLAEWIARFVFGEFFGVLFVVSVLGLIWAVATPPWLETILERASAKLLLVLMVILFLLGLAFLLL